MEKEMFENIEEIVIPVEGDEDIDDEKLGEIMEEEQAFEESLNLDEADRIDDASMDDPVKIYLHQIGGKTLLRAGEEVECAKLIEDGKKAKERKAKVGDQVSASTLEKYERRIQKGNEAKVRLMEGNLRLVVSIAKKYVGRGLLFLDLIQEGNLGLMKAVDKFDYRLGYKFSTYATWWIRQSMSRAIADQARVIRLPVHMGETMNKLKRGYGTLEQKLGRAPSIEELSIHTHIPESKILYVYECSSTPLSLESPVGEEEESCLKDFIEDFGDKPDEVAELSLLRRDIDKALATLSPKEERILRLRFGFESGSPKTLEEVGREYHVTRERIRQIEASALRKLRSPSKSKVLREYLQ